MEDVDSPPPPSDAVLDGEEIAAAQMAHDAAMTYADYLDLDRLLDAQHPQTDAHDELLFIIQHQTMELWMKLALYELDGAAVLIGQGRLRESFKMLTRVARIFDQLTSAWDVLRTLTPQEYLAYRNELGNSSGFQSWQYRAIEFALGNKDVRMLAAHDRRPAVQQDLARRLTEPSLYDTVLGLLAERGFDVPDAVLRRNRSVPHAADAGVTAIWRQVYSHSDEHWDIYELAEKLVDLEDYTRQFRFQHLMTVSRIIGAKAGTGGTSGVDYLRRRLDIVLFPELWEVRTEL